jgi:hypothetical protein
MAERESSTISFYTDRETRELLERLAQAEQRSVSNMLSIIIRDFGRRHAAATQPTGQREPVDYSLNP